MTPQQHRRVSARLVASAGAALTLTLGACTSTIAGSGSAATAAPTSDTSTQSSSSSSEASSSSESSSTSTTSRTTSSTQQTFGPDTTVTDLLWGIPDGADDWTVVDEGTGYRTFGPDGSCEVTYSQPAGIGDDDSDDPERIAERYTERALDSFAKEQGVSQLPDPDILDTDGALFTVETGEGMPDSIDFVGLHANYPLPSFPVSTQAFVLRVGEFALVVVTACHSDDFDTYYESSIEPIVMDSTVSIQP